MLKSGELNAVTLPFCSCSLLFSIIAILCFCCCVSFTCYLSPGTDTLQRRPCPRISSSSQKSPSLPVAPPLEIPPPAFSSALFLLSSPRFSLWKSRIHRNSCLVSKHHRRLHLDFQEVKRKNSFGGGQTEDAKDSFSFLFPFLFFSRSIVFPRHSFTIVGRREDCGVLFICFGLDLPGSCRIKSEVNLSKGNKKRGIQ